MSAYMYYIDTDHSDAQTKQLYEKLFHAGMICKEDDAVQSTISVLNGNEVVFFANLRSKFNLDYIEEQTYRACLFDIRNTSYYPIRINPDRLELINGNKSIIIANITNK